MDNDKKKMSDDEIMLFNELLMSKIHKRKIQPLEVNKIDKTCKDCGWLTKSIFKRNNLQVLFVII